MEPDFLPVAISEEAPFFSRGDIPKSNAALGVTRDQEFAVHGKGGSTTQSGELHRLELVAGGGIPEDQGFFKPIRGDQHFAIGREGELIYLSRMPRPGVKLPPRSNVPHANGTTIGTD